jgi:hypothetical protein
MYTVRTNDFWGIFPLFLSVEFRRGGHHIPFSLYISCCSLPIFLENHHFWSICTSNKVYDSFCSLYAQLCSLDLSLELQ